MTFGEFWAVLDASWWGASLGERTRGGHVSERASDVADFLTTFGVLVRPEHLVSAIDCWRDASDTLAHALRISRAEASYCVALGREACATALDGRGVPEDPTGGLLKVLLGPWPEAAVSLDGWAYHVARLGIDAAAAASQQPRVQSVARHGFETSPPSSRAP